MFFSEDRYSIFDIIRDHRYSILWYYLLWMISLFVIMSIIGLIIFNKSIIVSDDKLSEIITARKNFLKTIPEILHRGLLWFIITILSIFSTDSCGDNCFPFDDLVTLIVFPLFPTVTVITLFFAIYAYLLRDFTLMYKLLRIGKMWSLALISIIFIILKIFFGLAG